ncbi:MAG: methyltransferase type 11 [Frankiales bacterium]|nr:methyltransferase type 11 [Frankiales bacterium]
MASETVELDGVRWPVVDGILWHRLGRDALRARVVDLLDAGDVDGARVALFADADDWWGEPPPPSSQLAQVVSAGTLREAMDLLGYGRVGDYFAHRWSDPTYLAGLALLEQHWPGERPVVEVACGIGHFLRELHQRGVGPLVGVDVVFSKLWLAQRFVCPAARYVCADVTAGLPPLDLPGPAYVLCVDALYFLRDKPAAVAAMRALGDVLVVGHAHTPVEVHSSGEPLTLGQYADLLGADVVYDDDELTSAFLARRAPVPGARDTARAVALVSGTTSPGPDLSQPVGPVRPNPLYVDGVRTWPSPRWAEEYARATDYLPETYAPGPRSLLDLPEHW